jgi:hypothetical protein
VALALRVGVGFAVMKCALGSLPPVDTVLLVKADQLSVRLPFIWFDSGFKLRLFHYLRDGIMRHIGHFFAFFIRVKQQLSASEYRPMISY